MQANANTASCSASSSQPKYFGVQILRAFAAILVVLHHQAEAAGDAFPRLLIPSWIARGSVGVDIFFPISGFVLYLSAAAILKRRPRSGDWQTFAWRRIARVAPMYWLFTILKIACFLAFPALLLHYQFRVWNTIAAFLFLPALNYMHQPEPPLVVGWTLAYEMLFYAILTACLALRLPLLRTCTLAIIALALISLVLPHRLGGLTYLADPIELEFLAGMLIAACASRLRALPAPLACALFLGALGFTLGYRAPVLEFQPLRVLYWGIPGALMLLSVVSLEGKANFGRSRLLLLLGDASYALYLTHTFLVPATRVAVRGLHARSEFALVCFFLGGITFCLAVAVAVHLYVELPVLARLTAWRTPWSARSADSYLPSAQ